MEAKRFQYTFNARGNKVDIITRYHISDDTVFRVFLWSSSDEFIIKYNWDLSIIKCHGILHGDIKKNGAHLN